MKKLLIIAYPFPPVPYSGSYRILRLCKGLSALQYEVHVLTIKIDDRIPNDYELLDKIPETIKVHRITIPDPWLRFRHWKRRKRFVGLFDRLITRIIENALRVLTIPDHQILWIPLLVFKALGIISKHGVRVVLISAPPYSTLLGGSILKKLREIRFIADLRDPIVGNIAQVELLRPDDPYSRFMRKVHERLEIHIMRTADVVVANTETYKRELKDKYSIEKVVTVRNAFEPEDYQDLPAEKFNNFTVAHIGSLYGLRNVGILFEALQILEQRLRPDQMNIQILLVGSVSEETKKAVDAQGVGQFVKFIPQVPHKKALEIMLRSHLLLLVKAKGEGGQGQIPAKFFEYLGANNPIICIGRKNTELSDLIRKTNAGIAVENEVEALVDFLSAAYEAYLEYGWIPNKNKDIEEFSADRMAGRLAERVLV